MLRLRFEVDDYPDLSYLEQWDTPEKYAGNEILVNGVPIPFERYIRTYGDPNNYGSFIVTLERQCECCESWEVLDVVGGCDFMYDDDNWPGNGAYDPDTVKKLWPWIYEHFAHHFTEDK